MSARRGPRIADRMPRPPRGAPAVGEPTLPSGNPMLAIGKVDQAGGVSATDTSFGVSDARSLSSGSAITCASADNFLMFEAADGANVLLIRDDHEDRWIGIPAILSTLCTDPCWYY